MPQGRLRGGSKFVKVPFMSPGVVPIPFCFVVGSLFIFLVVFIVLFPPFHDSHLPGTGAGCDLSNIFRCVEVMLFSSFFFFDHRSSIWYTSHPGGVVALSNAAINQ